MTSSDTELKAKIALHIEHLADSSYEPIASKLITWVTRYAFENERYDIREEITPWDYSTYPERTGEGFDLTQYEHVSDFLDECNGQSRATYVSGAGMAAGTILEDFSEHMRELIYEYIRDQFPESGEPGERFLRDDLMDELCDEIMGLEAEIATHISEMEFKTCIEQGTFLARRAYEIEQEEERARIALRQQQMEDVKPIIADIESRAAGRSWVRDERHELFSLLDDVVVSHGKEQVAIALGFAHLHLSNSLKLDVQDRYISQDTSIAQASRACPRP